MQDAKIRLALLFVCLVCLSGSGFVLLRGQKGAAPPPVVITPPPTEAAPVSAPAPTSRVEATPKPSARVYVDVSGAVQRPSLYVLPAGSRVMQAVMAAGGPTAEADLEGINLAGKVIDGDKVFVPRRAAPPPPGSPALPASSSASVGAKPHAPERPSKVSADSGEQVALNTATREELERLPGVGPGMAGRILAYRQQAGFFQKVDDLQQVPGIGPKKYAKIAPFVKLN